MSVYELPLHERLKPHEVLEIARQRNPEKLVVIFYEADNPKECVIPSAMTQEECLWFAEILRLHALGIRGPS